MTLVAPPEGASQSLPTTVPDEWISLASAALQRGGAKPGTPDRFAGGRAVDLPFAGDPWDAGLAAAARQALDALPVDFAIQPAAPRQKRLLIADMDSTMVTSETLDDMAAALGVGDRVKAITKRAMNGELDFEGALRERVALLTGKDASIYAQTLAEIALSPGAEALVAGMTAAGTECRLVSGGFAYFVSQIADRMGFVGWQANDIEVKDGKFTGAVIPPVLDGSAKVKTLEARATALGIDMAAVAAVGDGANDAPMLARAGLGVAWRAKPSVREQARARIDHGDLSTMLLFQRLDGA